MSRLAVVSGGGSGIGAAITSRLVQDAYTVLIVGRREEALERTRSAIGEAVDTYVADLAEPKQVAELAAYVRTTYGSVATLVNNAGGNAEIGSPVDLNDLTSVALGWTENFRLNVLTAVLLTEALGPLVDENGRIVLVSSIAAYRGSGTGSYAASKSALHPYVYDLSRRFGPRKITVNAIAPGYVAETEFFGNALSGERKKRLLDEMLTGEPTLPKHVAGLVGWLMSPEAGQVTGQILQVNGGAQLGR